MLRSWEDDGVGGYGFVGSRVTVTVLKYSVVFATYSIGASGGMRGRTGGIISTMRSGSVAGLSTVVGKASRVGTSRRLGSFFRASARTGRGGKLVSGVVGRSAVGIGGIKGSAIACGVATPSFSGCFARVGGDRIARRGVRSFASSCVSGTRGIAGRIRVPCACGSKVCSTRCSARRFIGTLANGLIATCRRLVRSMRGRLDRRANSRGGG